jgi:hypothetical protein
MITLICKSGMSFKNRVRLRFHFPKQYLMYEEGWQMPFYLNISHKSAGGGIT